MAKIIVFAFLLALAASAASAKASSGGSHSVRGHVTKKGDYVPPHRATNPDSRKSNNWSQKGNVNPYTGKEGTKE
jgi:hypothetical protein